MKKNKLYHQKSDHVVNNVSNKNCSKAKQFSTKIKKNYVNEKSNIDHWITQKNQNIYPQQQKIKCKIQKENMKIDLKKKNNNKNCETRNTTFRKNEEIRNYKSEIPQHLLFSVRLKDKQLKSQTHRLGKSVDYTKYINKKFNSKKLCKSQTVSPIKIKSIQKQIKKKFNSKKIDSSRPSSVKTTSLNYVNPLFNNKQYSKSEMTNKLKQLIKGMKNEYNNQNVKEKKIQKEQKNNIASSKKQQLCFLKQKKKKDQSKLLQYGKKFENFSRKSTQKKFKKNKPINVESNSNIQFTQLNQNLIKQSSIEDIKNQNEIHHQIQYLNLTESDQVNQVDIQELRHIESTSVSKNLKIKKKLKLKSQQDQLIFLNKMAIKIQRCWRRYNTRKLVNSYIKKLNSKQKGIRLNCERSELVNKIEPHQKMHEQELLFQNEKNKIQMFGNGQEKESNQPRYENKYKEFIKNLKQKQFNKWDQIIKIISTSSEKNSHELLQRIIAQSEINRNKLEKQVISSDYQQSETSRNIIYSNLEFNESDKILESSNTEQEESLCKNPFYQFNSKKYKQLLNPDLIQELILEREIILQQRQNNEKQKLQLQKKLNKITQETYKAKLQKIQNWLREERELILTIKKQMQCGIQKVKQSIKKTQMDYLIMLKLKGQAKIKIKRSFSEQIFKKPALNKQFRIKQIIQYEIKNKKNDPIIYWQDKTEQLRSNQNIVSNQNNLLQQKQNLIKVEHSANINQRINTSQSEESGTFLKLFIKKQTHQLQNKEQQQFDSQSSSQNQPPQENTISSLVKLFDNKFQLGQKITQQTFGYLLVQYLKEIVVKECITENFKKVITNLKNNKLNNTKKQKGIKIVLQVIKIYLKGLIKHIVDNHQYLLKKLQKPNGPNAFEFLSYLHENSSSNQDSDLDNLVVLPKEIADQYWKLIQPTIIFEPLFTNKDKQHMRTQFLKCLMRLYMQAIFDAFNQALDKQKIYGTFGKPFPWKKNNSVFIHQKNSIKDYNKSLENAYNSTIENASTFCGTILQNRFEHLHQQQIRLLRQDRFKRLQQLEIKQKQQTWLFYDDQQTEILVQISNLLTTILFQQFTKQLFMIKFKR